MRLIDTDAGRMIERGGEVMGVGGILPHRGFCDRSDHF
jgi:hypothetical protein